MPRRPQAPARPAQGQERQPFTLEVDVDVVSVTAVVFDKGGHLVHGLGPQDVELLEDGVAQELSYFREASSEGDPAARVPLSVALVLDTSGSMGATSLHFLQEAVLSFVYKLEDVDQALVVSFNDSVKGSADFTGDTDRLERFVDGLQAWGGTSLYDAVHYSLERIKDQPGRKALVVFSDGDGHHELAGARGPSSTTPARWRPPSTASASRAREGRLARASCARSRARPGGSSSRPTRWAS